MQLQHILCNTECLIRGLPKLAICQEGARGPHCHGAPGLHITFGLKDRHIPIQYSSWSAKGFGEAIELFITA